MLGPWKRYVARYISKWYEKAIQGLSARQLVKCRKEWGLNDVCGMLACRADGFGGQGVLEIMRQEGLEDLKNFKVWFMQRHLHRDTC